MAIFEFRCRDCGSRFEVLTSYERSQGEMACTNCHSTNVRKLISLVAKRGKSGDDFGDDFGGGDFGGGNFGGGDFGGGNFGDDDYGDGTDMSSGSCGCGGACSCNN